MMATLASSTAICWRKSAARLDSPAASDGGETGELGFTGFDSIGSLRGSRGGATDGVRTVRVAEAGRPAGSRLATGHSGRASSSEGGSMVASWVAWPSKSGASATGVPSTNSSPRARRKVAPPSGEVPARVRATGRGWPSRVAVAIWHSAVPAPICRKTAAPRAAQAESAPAKSTCEVACWRKTRRHCSGSAP
jgi:hypothetical protein